MIYSNSVPDDMIRSLQTARISTEWNWNTSTDVGTSAEPMSKNQGVDGSVRTCSNMFEPIVSIFVSYCILSSHRNYLEPKRYNQMCGTQHSMRCISVVVDIKYQQGKIPCFMTQEVFTFSSAASICMRAGERIFDAQERLLPQKTWTLNGFTVQVCSGMFQQ